MGPWFLQDTLKSPENSVCLTPEPRAPDCDVHTAGSMKAASIKFPGPRPVLPGRCVTWRNPVSLGSPAIESRVPLGRPVNTAGHSCTRSLKDLAHLAHTAMSMQSATTGGVVGLLSVLAEGPPLAQGPGSRSTESSWQKFTASLSYGGPGTAGWPPGTNPDAIPSASSSEACDCWVPSEELGSYPCLFLPGRGVRSALRSGLQWCSSSILLKRVQIGFNYIR